MKLTNGIYLGDFALLKFYGTFDWLTDRKKLEFDFDRIAVLGLGPINLPGGGAAEIGAKTGLGAESNVDRAKSGKKAFFNWIWADGDVALRAAAAAASRCGGATPTRRWRWSRPRRRATSSSCPSCPTLGSCSAGCSAMINEVEFKSGMFTAVAHLVRSAHAVVLPGQTLN